MPWMKVVSSETQEHYIDLDKVVSIQFYGVTGGERQARLFMAGAAKLISVGDVKDPDDLEKLRAKVEAGKGHIPVAVAGEPRRRP